MVESEGNFLHACYLQDTVYQSCAVAVMVLLPWFFTKQSLVMLTLNCVLGPPYTCVNLARLAKSAVPPSSSCSTSVRGPTWLRAHCGTSCCTQCRQQGCGPPAAMRTRCTTFTSQARRHSTAALIKVSVWSPLHPPVRQIWHTASCEHKRAQF
jgi:hypothetical protein